MNLDELRALVAVADTGSVSGAAVKLHVTQPAMTRRLKRLESDLGIELFDRHNKPFRLTSAGLEVLERSRRVLRSVDEVYAASTDVPSGDCRVGVSLTFAGVALAKPIDEVRQQFPRVGLQVTTGWSPPLAERLKAGALDVAFLALLRSVTLPAGVAGTLLREYPVVCVAARGANLAKAVEPQSLEGASWVLNPEGCGARRLLQQTLQGTGVQVRVAVEVHGWELQLSLVARGVGFGLVPEWCIRRHPLAAKLRAFRIKGHDFHLGFWAAQRQDLGKLQPVADALGAAFTATVLTLR